MESAAHTPSPRHRPNFHLSLTPLLDTPTQIIPAEPGRTPYMTPQVSPFGISRAGATNYSPFRSAGLKPPSPYSASTAQFTPRPSRTPNSVYGNYTWFRLKRWFNSRALLLAIVILGLLWWWQGGPTRELKIIKVSERAFKLGNQIFHLDSEATRDLQFFPAVNPKIHYVGRWTSTPNRLRKDGTFPGVYFDLNVFNTTTLLIALQNQAQDSNLPTASLKNPTSPTETFNPGHVSFRHSPELDRPAPPISLLAQVDQEEYVLLPNSSSLVSVHTNSLDTTQEHQIRVIVPMTDNQGRGVVQLEGIWLSKHGKLLRVKNSLLDGDIESEDALSAENAIVGEKHRAGLNAILKSGGKEAYEERKKTTDEESQQPAEYRKKTVEIITDFPGSTTPKNRMSRSGGVEGLLAGVMGWEYLLGEMFGVDHVAVGVDGMCLMQDCKGAVGAPSGMGDVFFRSGPPHSRYFEHPWMFHGNVPDVLILNLGSSDEASFKTYESSYEMSAWEFSKKFEDTYVSFVNGIRRLAYPKHPAVIYSEGTGSFGVLPPDTPATIPIFIMRPLRGQLEHATQGVVNRLRADGDNGVFWLDTSGWLDETEMTEDFYLDKSAIPETWKLTEQGNQRVAIFLHMHVCRYLAQTGDRCAFLPPSVYQGKVFNPEEANFDRFLENDKEKKLKELFWTSEVGTKEDSVPQLT